MGIIKFPVIPSNTRCSLCPGQALPLELHSSCLPHEPLWLPGFRCSVLPIVWHRTSLFAVKSEVRVFCQGSAPRSEQPGPVAEPSLPSCLELLFTSLHSTHGTGAGQMRRRVRVSGEQLTSHREQMPARESAQPPLHLCKTQAERWGRGHLGTVCAFAAWKSGP